MSVTLWVLLKGVTHRYHDGRAPSKYEIFHGRLLQHR
jgi:hypothetical protein